MNYPARSAGLPGKEKMVLLGNPRWHRRQGKQVLMAVGNKVNRRTFPPFFLILTFLAIAGIAITGCSTGKVKPAAETPSLPPESILELIARADKREDTFEAVANIEINAEKRRYPLKVALVLKRPYFLKIVAIPLVGTPDFFLSLREDTLKVFLPLKREFYICRATPENLARFLPVSIHREEMVPLLMGIPPLTVPPAKDVDSSTATLEGNLYHIDITYKNGKRQSLWIDRTTGVLAKVAVFEHERLLYTALYEEYTEEGGIPMPRKVIITPDEPEKPGVVIEYSDIRFSTVTDTLQFDLPVPPGIEPIIIH